MEVCFSGPSLALLGSIWLVIQGTIVTLFWLYVRSKAEQLADQKEQTTKAEAREAEWRRLALRGADEIIPPLASVARVRVQEQMRELRELREPRESRES